MAAISGMLPFMSSSVPPNISTSSSSFIMPPRVSILRNLYGWLRTWTQASISGLGNISRFIRFVSESLEIPSSARRNTTVESVHDPPPWWLSVQDFFPSLHTIYGYMTGLLFSLMGLKFQGSTTYPVNENPTLTTLFLIAIFVYIIALIITLRRSNHHMMNYESSKLMVGVCHISGALACEIQLLFLVSPLKSLLINVSAPALIVMLVLCYKYICHEQQADGGSDEMADLEAPSTSTATN